MVALELWLLTAVAVVAFVILAAFLRLLPNKSRPTSGGCCGSKGDGQSQPEWRSAVFQTLAAAEDHLDQLETCGHAERELRLLDDTTYEVRWR